MNTIKSALYSILIFASTAAFADVTSLQLNLINQTGDGIEFSTFNVEGHGGCPTNVSSNLVNGNSYVSFFLAGETCYDPDVPPTSEVTLTFTSPNSTKKIVVGCAVKRTNIFNLDSMQYNGPCGATATGYTCTISQDSSISRTVTCTK